MKFYCNILKGETIAMEKMTDTIPALQAQLTPELRERKGQMRKPVAALCAAFCAATLLLSLSFFTPAYALHIGDVPVGTVQSQQMVEGTVEQVEGQIAGILGRDYSMDLTLYYRFTIAPRSNLMGYSNLAQELYDSSAEIKAAYVLSADGVELGAVESHEVLDEVLALLTARYSTENTREAFFANELRVTRKYIPAQEPFSTGEELLAAAAAPSAAMQPEQEPVAAVARVYDVSEGSFLAGGAVSESAESELGPLVTVTRELPQLSVCTIDRVSYIEEIESPVQEIPNPELYEGDTIMILEGSPGLQWVTADVTNLNGERLYEEVLSATALREATVTLMAIGTKERPLYMGTGDFQWPVSGSITSPFGYRNIFGSTSFHTGLDIANSRGTPIYAADSGIVTFASYQGTYGNMIILDHGNGYETAYAHCDSMFVSIGQGVLQGEQIGTVGTSGRATGNHCHFEVREWGTQVNPQRYLP